MASRLLIDIGPASGAHGQRGIGRYVRGLVAGIALLPDDMSGRIWAMGERGPTLDTFGVRVAQGVQVHGPRWAPTWVSGPFATRAALRESGAAVLHQTDPQRPWAGRGTSSIVTVYDLIPLAETGLLRSWRPDHQALYRRYLHQVRSAAAILAISDTTALELQERLGIEPRRIDVVYPVVGPAVRLARIETAEPTFLYVGALDSHKQPELAVRALAAFRSRSGGGRLRFIGPVDAEREQVLRALVASLGVTADVTFEGHVADEDLDRAYGSAAALLWTSRNEGFGLPPVEAAIRGVPVIAVETRAAVETLRGVATIVPPDIQAVASAMANPVAPTAQALDALVERFSAASAARSLANCYRKVLD